jgi:hypothetical protein
MLRKLLIAAAIANVLLVPASAFAEPVHQKTHVSKNANANRNVRVNKNINKNVNVNRSVHVKKNVNVNRAAHGNYVVGKAYNGHYWYGQNRHRWHGRWYAYGIGPCWINVDGLWFWNVAACP